MRQKKTSHVGKLKARLCSILFAICYLNIGPDLSGAEVYRWVDANGVVTYSQQKPNNTNSIPVTTAGTPPSALIAQENARVAQESLKTELTEKQQQLIDLQTREANRIAAETALRDSLCESSTKRLAKLTEKDRVRVQNPDGSLRILAEEERQERITSARDKIDENCK